MNPTDPQSAPEVRVTYPAAPTPTQSATGKPKAELGGGWTPRSSAQVSNMWLLVAVGLMVSLVAIGILGLTGVFYLGPNAALFPLVGAAGAIWLGVSKLRGVEAESDQTRRIVNDDPVGPTLIFNSEMSGEVKILPPENDASAAAASASIRRQEAILREIYTQGLAQAKISFTVSIFFAAIGAALLFLGVGLAVTRAASDGDRYASIVAGLAGTVINLTSGLFFLQSNRARANMVNQGTLLREESQEDRRITTARELAAAIVRDDLRDSLRSELARALIVPGYQIGVPAEEEASAPPRSMR